MAPSKSSSTVRRRLDFEEKAKSTSKSKEVIDLTAKPITGPPKKRDLHAFLTSSPTKTASATRPPKTAAAFVTPTKKSKAVDDVGDGKDTSRSKDGEQDLYIPTYIHKNVHYLRKGQAKLDDKTTAVYNLIEENYHLPQNLEQGKEYGALSGSCYEERAISAYAHGMLEPKHPESDSLEICTECASTEHVRDACPTLI